MNLKKADKKSQKNEKGKSKDKHRKRNKLNVKGKKQVGYKAWNEVENLKKIKKTREVFKSCDDYRERKIEYDTQKKKLRKEKKWNK